MASGHLVTDGDLPLLGYVDLGELHDSVREFVTHLDLVHLPLALCLRHFVGDAVVVDEVLDHSVGVLVGCPLAGIDVLEVNALELICGDFLPLGDDLDSVEVADTGALLSVGEELEPSDEVGIEFLSLLVEVFLENFKTGLLIGLCRPSVAFLGCLCIEGCLDDCTAQ